MANDPKKPFQTAPPKPSSPPPASKPGQPSHQPFTQPSSPAPKHTDPTKKK